MGKTALRLVSPDPGCARQGLQVRHPHAVQKASEKGAGDHPPRLPGREGGVLVGGGRGQASHLPEGVRGGPQQPGTALAGERFGSGAGGTGALYEHNALPHLQGGASEAGSALRQDRREEYSRRYRPLHHRRPVVFHRAFPHRQGGGDCPPDSQRDPGTSPISDQCGARLPHPRSHRRHTLRWRRTANPPCYPDRLLPGGGPLHP